MAMPACRAKSASDQNRGAPAAIARLAATAALASITVLLLTGCPAQERRGHGPVADAGADQSVEVGSEVVLDGSGSHHAGGGSLAFDWYLISAPLESEAVIQDHTSIIARIVPDRVGVYHVGLRVSDGRLSSVDEGRIDVRPAAENRPPVADAGADQTVAFGATVALDGGGSSDPDGDALIFAWSFADRPEESATELADATTATPRFVADALGAFVVRLEVSDGTLSDTDELTVNVEPAPVEQPPIARAGGDQVAFVGDTVRLDGGASTGPHGIALSYAWVLLERPDGSTTSLTGGDAMTAHFLVDAAGEYRIGLTVSDGHASDTDEVRVTATPYIPTGSIHVAPVGDDEARGTADAPLRTLARAFEVAHAHEGVTRVRVAGGTYAHDPEREPFGYAMGRDLVIEGEDRDAVIFDGAGRPLLRVDAGASLVLMRATLRTAGVAVEAAAGSQVLLSDLACVAAVCVRADAPPGGANVIVSDAVLQAADVEPASAHGITVGGGSLVLSDTTVTGFGVGVSLDAADALLRNVHVRDGDVGLRVAGGLGATSTNLMDAMVDGHRIGAVVTDARFAAVQSAFENNHDVGLTVDGGAVVMLQASVVADNGLRGIDVVGASVTLSGGEVLRNGHRPSDRIVIRGGARAAAGAYVRADGTIFDANDRHLLVLGDAMVHLDDATLLGAFGRIAGPDPDGGVEARDAIVMSAPAGHLRIDGGVIAENRLGLWLADGLAELHGVDVHSNASGGLHVRGGRLTLRGTTLNNDITNLLVDGAPDAVDLGTVADPGGNVIHASAWLLLRRGIDDARPARAETDGPVLTAYGTTCTYVLTMFDSGSILAGDTLRVGPDDSGANRCWRIVNANNRIAF